MAPPRWRMGTTTHHQTPLHMTVPMYITHITRRLAAPAPRTSRPMSTCPRPPTPYHTTARALHLELLHPPHPSSSLHTLSTPMATLTATSTCPQRLLPLSLASHTEHSSVYTSRPRSTQTLPPRLKPTHQSIHKRPAAALPRTRTCVLPTSSAQVCLLTHSTLPPNHRVRVAASAL